MSLSYLFDHELVQKDGQLIPPLMAISMPSVYKLDIASTQHYWAKHQHAVKQELSTIHQGAGLSNILSGMVAYHWGHEYPAVNEQSLERQLKAQLSFLSGIEHHSSDHILPGYNE